MSNSLPPHGLYSPWNSPGQNTNVGSLSLLQGIFPTQRSNPGLHHYRQILYQLSYWEAQEYWSGYPIPSLGDLPDPGVKPGSPASQADSYPTELLGKPIESILQHNKDHRQQTHSQHHCCCRHSIMFNSLRPHGLQRTRLICPWNYPGKNTGVGSHFLLQ